LPIDQLAARIGLPLDRVKSYFALLAASDPLLTFFDKQDIPLKVAVEFMRFEKATSEARARRLVARYLDSAMSVKEIAARRKSQAEGSEENERAEEKPKAEPRAPLYLRPIEKTFAADSRTAAESLGAAVARFGYRLVLVTEKGANEVAR